MSSIKGPITPGKRQTLAPISPNASASSPNSSQLNESTLSLLESSKLQRESKNLKTELCVQALIDGNPLAFSDLFELSHRPPVVIDPISEAVFIVPDNVLPMVKEKLQIAENAKDAGDFAQMYECYRVLAEYLEGEKDYEAALSFYSKGLESVVLSSDKPLECIANMNLGCAYERLGQTVRAIAFHEAHEALASASDDAASLAEARVHLASTYSRYASELESRDNLPLASTYLEKALDMAVASQDEKLQAETHQLLASLWLKLGAKETALGHAKTFLEISQKLGNNKLIGDALATLAQLYDALDDLDGASSSLLDSLTLSESDPAAQSELCSRLGSLYSKMGRHDKAVEFFERNFNIISRSDDKKAIAAARMQLGFARGQSAQSKFLHMVTSDVSSILEWKDSRKKFSPA